MNVCRNHIKKGVNADRSFCNSSCVKTLMLDFNVNIEPVEIFCGCGDSVPVTSGLSRSAYTAMEKMKRPQALCCFTNFSIYGCVNMHFTPTLNVFHSF